MCKTCLHLWNHFEVYVANTALAILVIMITIQATARYLLHIGLPWTEEISRFSFIFFVYISASLAVFRGTHIKVEVLVNILPQKARKALIVFGNVAQVCFFLTAGVAGVQLVVDMVEFPVYSPSLLLPLYYVYFIIPLSYILMAVRLVQRTFCGTNA